MEAFIAVHPLATTVGAARAHAAWMISATRAWSTRTAANAGTPS